MGGMSMRADIQTNTTPIRAGDLVTIDFHPLWTDFGTLYYSVHLSFDGGRSFPKTIAASVYGGSVDWVVDVIGNGLIVQVRGHLILGTKVSNTAPFTIVPSTPFVTAPRSDERVSLAGPTTVRWEQIPPQPDTYTIFCSHDGGAFQQLATNFSGSARHREITFPGPATNQATLRLSGGFPGFTPLSHDVPIRLTNEPVVHVTSPNTRVIWRLGDTQKISWSVVGPVDHFTIQLSRNNGQSWTTVASNVSGAQREFMCPVDPPASESCKVRVTAYWSGGSVSDQSDTVFHIRGPGPDD
jgi:hypothetical protein